MHLEVACCTIEIVTVVCTVCGHSSQAIQNKHCYRLLEASGKATGLYRQLTCVVGEDWSERSQYYSSQCCLHDLSKLHTEGSGNSNSFVNSLYKNWRPFPVLLAVLFRPSLARLVPFIGKTSRSSFPAAASSTQAPQ